MKSWSKYNTLFKSERFGFFLYNAMSNTFIELDETHYDCLVRFVDNRESFETGVERDFIDLLERKHVLIAKGGDERGLLIKQFQRNCSCYGKADIAITICPTLACNFDCKYCFENTQNQSTVIQDHIIEKLIEFIKKMAVSEKVYVSWYGGEPTLAFDTIQTITTKIMDEGLKLKSDIATNGYLLTKNKIQALNDLNIEAVQITLDGPRQVHDKRRCLKGGGATYNRIIRNIDTLMNSDYKGACNIRVNVDKTNIDTYVELREELLERYPDSNVTVYASPVKGRHSQVLSKDEWVLFCIELYERFGIVSKSIFYPHGSQSCSCVANTSNMFVIGTNGEIYKCWEDVGKNRRVVGNICHEEPITNQELLAIYTIGTDPYADTECLKCRFLPICAEICARDRMEGRFFDEKKSVDYCTHFKRHMIVCLEVFYDIYSTSEISRELLNLSEVEPMSRKGYRIIRSGEEKSASCTP